METNNNISRENHEPTPGGKDKTFDPVKARELVNHLRSREKDLEKQVASLQRELEDAGKQSETKIGELEAKIGEYEKAYEAKEAELRTANEQAVKTRLLNERGIPTNFTGMLTGDSEEEWTANADLLAAFRDGAAKEEGGLQPDPVQATATSTGDVDSETALAMRIFGD